MDEAGQYSALEGGKQAKTTCTRNKLCTVVISLCVVAGGCFAYYNFVIRDFGTCPLSTYTGYSCQLLKCGDNRGVADCVQGKCMCRPGYCSQDSVCILNETQLTAVAARVDSEHPVFPGLHGRVTTALCISGGGSRSLAIAAGALRALEHLQLMQHVDAISAVSGGAWAAGIYMFANRSKAELLGDISTPTDPSTLTMDVLNSMPPQLGESATHSLRNFHEYFRFHGRSETAWIRFVGASILKNFDLDSMDVFMAATKEDVKRIRDANPKLQSQPFITMQQDRPKVLVIGATVLAPLGENVDGGRVVPLQISPDFTGMPFHPFGVTGGGLVETFAIGGSEPRAGGQGGGDAVSVGAPDVPFSLADALGISSAAFGAAMSNLAEFGVEVTPQVKLWPVTPVEGQTAKVYTVGDGGNMENSGLLAMLQRKATRIVWLIDTDTGLDSEVNFCSWIDPSDPNGHVTNQITDKFGWGINSKSKGFLQHNQVFEKGHLKGVLCELQTLKSAGKPAVYRSKLRVVRNEYWGIEGGFDVDMVFFYNELSTHFVDSLPEDTHRNVKLGHGGPFSHYPFLKTTNQNMGEVIQYTYAQVNLLSAHAEFFVMQNKDIFEDVFRAS